MTVLFDKQFEFEVEIPVVVVGAGACGIIAGLTAQETGSEVLVLERDDVPRGSTALSSGMIPACETRLQEAKGVDDSIALLSADIRRKSRGGADLDIVEAICRESGSAIDWLIEQKGVPLQLVHSFLYPGHSVHRMHAPPSMTGAELIGALSAAAEKDNLDIVTNAHVSTLVAQHDGLSLIHI